MAPEVKFSVSLVSRVRHSVYAARALHGQGWLHSYLGPVVFGDTAGPKDPRRRRYEPAITGVPMSRMATAEFVIQFANRTLSGSRQRQTASSVALDIESLVRLKTGSGVLHWNTEGLRVLPQRSRDRGMVLVADHRALHPADEYTSDWPRYKHALRELELADVIIANSRAAARSMCDRGIDPQRIEVLNLGVERWTGSRPAPLIERGRRVVFVGAVHRRKGVDVLAAALEGLAGLDIEEVSVVGCVQDDGLARTLRKSHPAVRIYGRLERRQVLDFCSTARLLVLPSNGEAFGLVALEALSMGTPVVVSSACGVHQVVREDFRRGSVFEAGDADGLAAFVLKYLDLDGIPTDGIGAEGYYWEDYQEKLVSIYRSRIVPLMIERRVG